MHMLNQPLYVLPTNIPAVTGLEDLGLKVASRVKSGLWSPEPSLPPVKPGTL